MKTLALLVLLACGTPSATEPRLEPEPLVPPRHGMPTDIVPWPAPPVFPDSGYGRDPRPEYHQRTPDSLQHLPPVRVTPSCPFYLPRAPKEKLAWASTLPHPMLLALGAVDCGMWV